MKGAAAIRGRVRRPDGQVLAFVAVSMVVLIGMVAIVFDIGRVYVAQQQLQTAVDAAALVAGQNLPNATTSYGTAVSYSGAAGDKNAIGGYGVTSSSPTVTFECLSYAPNYTTGTTPTCPTDTSNANCQPSGAQATQPSGATTCNAVKVTETATVNMTLAGLFLPKINVTASSTAAARGGSSHPLSVYVILDNTGSMSSNLCSGTVTGVSSPDRLDCAKAGVRALLQALWPCASGLASCGAATANSSGLGANVAAPVDEVGMLVFPAISGNPPSSTILNKEVDCNASSSFAVNYPPWTAYTASSTPPNFGVPTSDQYLGYQAVGLSSDYRPSVANTTLNWTTSQLVESVDWGQCPGMTYPGAGDNYGLKDIGGLGSYLAGSITEAQHLLDVNARPGATNAIIVLSDGQLTAMTQSKNSFTDSTPCASAISAATQAKAAGTVIYAIAYGSNGTTCPNSSSTDLQTMQGIASNSETFFNQPTSGDLTLAFQQVGTDLTNSRLIPNCVAPATC
jgi:hypothetical protein